MYCNIKNPLRSLHKPLLSLFGASLALFLANTAQAQINTKIFDAGGPSISVNKASVRLDESSAHQIKDDATQFESRGAAAQALMFRWDNSTTQISLRRTEMKSRATWDKGSNMVNAPSGNATWEIFGVSLPKKNSSACSNDPAAQCVSTGSSKSASIRVAEVTASFYGVDLTFFVDLGGTLGAQSNGKAFAVHAGAGGTDPSTAGSEAHASVSGSVQLILGNDVALLEDIVDAGLKAEFTLYSWDSTVDGGGAVHHRSKDEVWAGHRNKAVSSTSSGGGAVKVYGCIVGACEDLTLYSWPGQNLTSTTHYDATIWLMAPLNGSAW